jgi:hypothetical protein
VSVVCCQVEVSATSWSLVQGSPTECSVSKKCVVSWSLEKWGGLGPQGAVEPFTSVPCYCCTPYNFLPLFSPCPKGSTWPYWDRFSHRYPSSHFWCLSSPPPTPSHCFDSLFF